ncbi:hypothetical protein [Pseudarthrobacter sp. Y6]|uniref:hypothetical protein n=1 Tax=Pseudarthrobacter sp. Y6 TaxID=3418422 RepID=UPI003CF82975
MTTELSSFAEDEDAADLTDVATSFAVHGELTKRLAEVHSQPFDAMAQQRLRKYLTSPRLRSGNKAAHRLKRGAA